MRKKSGAPSQNKYGAKKAYIDGHRFDSLREGRRYMDLKLLERAGEIRTLRLQVPYFLHVRGEKIGKYIADFVYWEGGKEIVEDCKGLRTPIYRWKARHFAAESGQEILET